MILNAFSEGLTESFLTAPLLSKGLADEEPGCFCF
jgi:hypothetical protein